MDSFILERVTIYQKRRVILQNKLKEQIYKDSENPLLVMMITILVTMTVAIVMTIGRLLMDLRNIASEPISECYLLSSPFLSLTQVHFVSHVIYRYLQSSQVNHTPKISSRIYHLKVESVGSHFVDLRFLSAFQFA